MKNGLRYLFILLFVSFSAFAQKPTTTFFKPVPNNETGINFANVLKESPALNIISYEYFYNGGGVGLGDFNNDGLIDIYFSALNPEGKPQGESPMNESELMPAADVAWHIVKPLKKESAI